MIIKNKNEYCNILYSEYVIKKLNVIKYRKRDDIKICLKIIKIFKVRKKFEKKLTVNKVSIF